MRPTAIMKSAGAETVGDGERIVGLLNEVVRIRIGARGSMVAYAYAFRVCAADSLTYAGARACSGLFFDTRAGPSLRKSENPGARIGCEWLQSFG